MIKMMMVLEEEEEEEEGVFFAEPQRLCILVTQI